MKSESEEEAASQRHSLKSSHPSFPPPPDCHSQLLPHHHHGRPVSDEMRHSDRNTWYTTLKIEEENIHRQVSV